MQLATGAHHSSAVPDTAPLASLGPGALERAFDEHHALVYRTAYRVTGNAADAEDVLQTVFLRLAGREGSADLMVNPEFYLRRAAVNAALNLMELRSRKNVPLESAPEPHAATDQSDLREVLRRAMATLEGRAAEMFALRFLEGYSNGEIGDMYGVSAVVVAVTVHRARRQLQKEIQTLGGLK